MLIKCFKIIKSARKEVYIKRRPTCLWHWVTINNSSRRIAHEGVMVIDAGIRLVSMNIRKMAVTSIGIDCVRKEAGLGGGWCTGNGSPRASNEWR